MRNLYNAKEVRSLEPAAAAIPPKPTNRSLIPAHRLKINRAWIDRDLLLVDVVDRKSGRQEILQIIPTGGIRHVPRHENVKLMIRLYVKYDLRSQEQFICLTEAGKQEYLRIMRDGFNPRLCLLWMKQLIDYIDNGINPEMDAIKYNPIQSLNKTIKQWAQKERQKIQ